MSQQNGIASVLRLVTNTVKVPFTTFHFTTVSQPKISPKESGCCCMKSTIIIILMMNYHLAYVHIDLLIIGSYLLYILYHIHYETWAVLETVTVLSCTRVMVSVGNCFTRKKKPNWRLHSYAAIWFQIHSSWEVQTEIIMSCCHGPGLRVPAPNHHLPCAVTISLTDHHWSYYDFPRTPLTRAAN